MVMENIIIENADQKFILVPMPSGLDSGFGLADLWLQGWADLKFSALGAKSAGDEEDLQWFIKNDHLISEDLRGTTLVFRDVTKTIHGNRPLLTFGVLDWGGKRWIPSTLAFKTTVITQGFVLVLRLAPT